MDIPATVNQLVNVEFVNLALEIPAAHSVRLLPRITRDLAGPYEAVRAERFGALLVHLVNSGDSGDSGDSGVGGVAAAALDLARVLWGFAPSAGDQLIPGTTRDLRTHIDSASYAGTLRSCLPPLVAAGGPDVLEAMAGLLDDAITRTSSPAMIETRQDLSTLWRPAIAGQPLDTDTDAKTALVSAVRDTAGQLVHDGDVELAAVLARLDSRDWPIFRRLVLYLVRRFGAGCPEEVARRLTDPAAIKDPFAEREFLLLAGDYFATLPDEQQQRVLSLIDQGPEVGAWAARYAAQACRDPSGDQIEQWVAEWSRDRLGAWSRPYRSSGGTPTASLSGWWANRCPRSKREPPRGSRRDFARPLRGHRAGRVEHRQAHRIPADPAGGRRRRAAASSSTYNLAQELGSAVRSTPLRYSAAADRFAGVPEPYVVQVLGGLHAAFENGADLDWTSILRLCEWMSGHETSVACGVPWPESLNGERPPRNDHCCCGPAWITCLRLSRSLNVIACGRSSTGR